MNRRHILCSAGILLAGCVSSPNGSDNQGSKGTRSDYVLDTEFSTEVSDAPPPNTPPTITYQKEMRSITIISTVTIPNSCHNLRLEEVNVNNQKIYVNVISEDTSRDGVNCSSESSFSSYSLDIQLDDSLDQPIEQVRINPPVTGTTEYDIKIH